MVVAVLFCLAFTRGSAQVHTYKHFTVDNGLISNVVYAAYCDSIGNMWFGTDKGVQRFDGKMFTHYLTAEDYAFNEVFEIFEDDAGHIWFSCMFGAHFQVSGDSVIPFAQNDLIKELIEPAKELRLAHISRDRTLTGDAQNKGLITVSDSGLLSINCSDTNRLMEFNGRFHLVLDCVLGSGPEKFPVHIKALGVDSVWISESDLWSSRRYWLQTKDAIYCSFGGDLLTITDGRCTWTAHDHSIIDICADRAGRIWLTYATGGVSCLDSAVNTAYFSFLDQLSVTKVVQDRTGGYWFTTLNHGLFYVPDLHAINYVNEGLTTNHVVALDRVDQELYVAYQNGDIYALNDDYRKELNVYGDNKVRQFLYDLAVFPNGTMLACQHGPAYCIPNDAPISVSAIDYKTIKKDAGHTYGASGYTGYLIDQDLKSDTLFDFSDWRDDGGTYRIQSVRDFAVGPEGTCLIASLNGGFVALEKGATRAEVIPELIDLNICAVENVDGVIFWATTHSGVAYGSADSDTLQWFTNDDGLPSDRTTCLYNDGDSLMWVGTSGGLTRIDLNTLKVTLVKSSASGLLYDHVTDISADASSLYVATYSGLSVLERAFLRGDDTPSIEHLAVFVGREPLETFSDHELDNGQNDLRFVFQDIAFQLNEVRYEYMLEGLNSEWVDNTSGEALFPALGAGSYQFKVRSLDKLDNVSEMVSSRFTIARHWTSSWWFIALMIFAFLALASGFVVIVNRLVRQKVKQQNLQAHYREQTIRSRMDPHFIFNSLNSLQYFLVSEQTKDASKYLNTFSKLLRNNIEYAKDDLISLEQEFELLEAYCKLEAMRFEEELEYEITVADGLKLEEYFIPAMIIQPVVENAIWHGLLPRQTNRQLVVHVSIDMDSLKVQVADNGIGMAKALAKRKESDRQRKHHSSGFIRKRLALYSEIMGRPYTISYKDKRGDETYPGTICTLVFPKVRNKNLFENE